VPITKSALDPRIKVRSCTADTTRNNSEVLLDITGMSFVCAANVKYGFEAVFYVTSAAAADLKLHLEAGGGSGAWCGVATNSGFNGLLGVADNFPCSTTGQPFELVKCSGVVQQGAAAATHKWQFAQNTANVSNTTIFAGSVWTIWQI